MMSAPSGPRLSQARRVAALALSLLALSCARREEGLLPAGAAAEPDAALARHVRRLHLDLAGVPPTPAALSAALARLQKEGNTAAARGALAEALLGAPAFAEGFVAELERRAFAGQGREGAYQLICGFYRQSDPDCARCGAPPADACGACACRVLGQLRLERDQLVAAPADLQGGTTTAEIERRYAAARGFRLLFGSPEATAQALFQGYLGRAPAPDELRNASAMVTGPLVSARAPSGLLFHRHGSGYGDLVDILFTAEAYRESLVDRVFSRYLGRPPTPRERAHFSAQIDAERPDARPLIQRIVSSQEYYEQ